MLYISPFHIFSTQLAVRGEYTLHIDLQIFPEAVFGLFSKKKKIIWLLKCGKFWPSMCLV